MAVDLRALVREIPDFQQPGIGFKDITPVLADPAGLDAAVSGLAEQARALGGVDVVIGAEARGFLLGPALAPAALRSSHGDDATPRRRVGPAPRG